MRIAIIAIALLLAGPACAEAFKPPLIVVKGWPEGATSKKGARQMANDIYRKARPGCLRISVELQRLDGENEEVFFDRQNRTYVFCMVEEFASSGMSVIDYVPTISGN